MRKYLFLLGVTASLTAIASASTTWEAERISAQVLAGQKYHDVQLLWIQPGTCLGLYSPGQHQFDYNRTGFRAVNATGHMVYGEVCMGRVYLYQDIPYVKLLHVKGYHDVEKLKSLSMQCPDKNLDHNRMVFRAVSSENRIVNGSVCNGEIVIDPTVRM